jgi:outer membrane protein assembly factor BamB
MNGRVFLQSASPSGEERWLQCIDLETGRILWTDTTTGQRGRFHKLNSLASSTPAADTQRVYSAVWDGREIILQANDHEGKKLWRRNLGAFSSQHGPGTSPIVHGNRVYLANDQDGAATLYAIHARTGEITWQADRKPFRASYACPLIVDRPSGGSELLVASTAGVTSYAPETGKTNWNWEWTFSGEPLRCVALPQVWNDHLIVNAGDGGGDRSVVALRLNADANGSRVAWRSDRRSFPYVPSSLIHGDHLYFVNDKGFAGCVAAASGEEIWTERIGTSEFLASPLLINGKIYAFSQDGSCYVFAVKDKFELVARNEIGERIRATPAVARGRLLVRGETHLICLGGAKSAAQDSDSRR